MGLFDKIGQFDKLVYQYYDGSKNAKPKAELNKLEGQIDALYADIIGNFKSKEAESIANAKTLEKNVQSSFAEVKSFAQNKSAAVGKSFLNDSFKKGDYEDSFYKNEIDLTERFKITNFLDPDEEELKEIKSPQLRQIADEMVKYERNPTEEQRLKVEDLFKKVPDFMSVLKDARQGNNLKDVILKDVLEDSRVYFRLSDSWIQRIDNEIKYGEKNKEKI